MDGDFEIIAKPNGSIVQQMKLTTVIEQRRVFLYDDVNSDSIFECVYCLHRIMDYDRKFGCDKKPVYIMINTDGGELHECFTLLSLIEQMKDDGYEIITVNMGRAFSAGFLILISGTSRFAYRHSYAMFHDLSGGCSGKFQNLKEYMNFISKLRKDCTEIVEKYTKISNEQLSLWLSNKEDKFFNAEECLEFGICDKVL